MNRQIVFPITITCVEDQGIHVTLDDFIPKAYVREFLNTLTETEAYELKTEAGEWPEYEELLKALE